MDSRPQVVRSRLYGCEVESAHHRGFWTCAPVMVFIILIRVGCNSEKSLGYRFREVDKRAVVTTCKLGDNIAGTVRLYATAVRIKVRVAVRQQIPQQTGVRMDYLNVYSVLLRE